MQNKYATGACDGLQPVLLNVNDISSRPKTAETLLEIVESEIEYILNVLQAILVAWCTDASGESAKMRRLLVRRYPWLVVLDQVIQVQLVVGDLWRADDPLIRAMDRAKRFSASFSLALHAGLLIFFASPGCSSLRNASDCYLLPLSVTRP